MHSLISAQRLILTISKEISRRAATGKPKRVYFTSLVIAENDKGTKEIFFSNAKHCAELIPMSY